MLIKNCTWLDISPCRTFKVATHRAVDTGFCLTRGLWLEGSAMGQLTAALHQGAALAPGSRPQAPGPSERSNEPVLARPQKSPLPHSDGHRSDLGRGTRPHPGGRSIRTQLGGRFGLVLRKHQQPLVYLHFAHPSHPVRLLGAAPRDQDSPMVHGFLSCDPHTIKHRVLNCSAG